MLFRSYVNIIKDRWDNQFYRDIHAAAYWLNPAFQYDSSTLNKSLETQSTVTDVIESKVSVGRLKLVEELRLFRERKQTFGTQLAQESVKTSQPGKILFTLTNNKMKICFKDHSFFFNIFGISIAVFIDSLYLYFVLYMKLR